MDKELALWFWENAKVVEWGIEGDWEWGRHLELTIDTEDKMGERFNNFFMSLIPKSNSTDAGLDRVRELHPASTPTDYMVNRLEQTQFNAKVNMAGALSGVEVSCLIYQKSNWSTQNGLVITYEIVPEYFTFEESSPYKCISGSVIIGNKRIYNWVERKEIEERKPVGLFERVGLKQCTGEVVKKVSVNGRSELRVATKRVRQN
ncbi:hypothetical protein GR11A_00063 [Vibrio phage vB_VcorM_GR11A]|nr:hypothetical protein GR11A_00063 [Vibrio phage vB_VcorM_GR11A]